MGFLPTCYARKGNLMRELATIEVFRLANELGRFRGYYIDKLYELAEGRFRLRVTQKGEKAYLNCVLPNTLNETSTIEKADTATGFATAFRKRTAGFVITGISQLGRDRIIRMDAEKGESSICVIFELFGKGNLIITDRSMKVLLAYRRQEFKERTVATGREYAPPKGSTVDFTSGAAYGIEYEESGEAIGRYFASRLGTGKMYIEEAILRAGANPSDTAASLKDRMPELEDSIRRLIGEAIGEGGVRVYMENGSPIDFALVDLEKYKGYESEECASLNDALDIVYSSMAEASAEQGAEEEDSTEIKAMTASIEKQRKSIDGLVAESEKNKNLGTVIFNNMEAINAIISAAKADRHATAESLQGSADGMKVLSVDLKGKKLVLDIEDGEERGNPAAQQ